MTQKQTKKTHTRGKKALALVADHLRFSAMNLLMLASIIMLGQGGGWIWVALISSFLMLTIAERFFGSAVAEAALPHPFFLTAMLWLTLPMVFILATIGANVTIAANPIVDSLAALIGLDLANARAQPGFFSTQAAVTTVGAYCGLAGVVGHELMHRPNDKMSKLIASWLFAFNWDTQFIISHVALHHRFVATEKDPVSARRGEYIGAFLIRSTVGQLKFAYVSERDRLAKRPLANRLLQNRFWRGQAISLVLIVYFLFLCGWIGFIWALNVAVVGKLYLEIVDYVEHYGLVRVPGSPVVAHHSWDYRGWLELGMLYNLPFHSHHHSAGSLPFWKLHASNGKAMELPAGYLVCGLCAFVPPLWHKLIDPLLAQWDREFASPAERDLLRQKGLLLG